jgi:AraC family transcriptional regulator
MMSKLKIGLGVVKEENLLFDCAEKRQRSVLDKVMSSPSIPERATPHITRLLYSTMGISLVDFHCWAGVELDGPEEPNPTHSIVLVRRGVFQRRQHRAMLTADPNHILLFNALHPYRYSHPLPGGDDCTILAVETDTALNLVAQQSPWDAEKPGQPFHIPCAISSHRAAGIHYELLALLRRPSPQLVIEDAMVELVEETIRSAYASYGEQRKREKHSRASADAARRHRDLTEAAKLAINESLGALPALGDLAQDLGCSPFHLSRIFHQTAGMSLRRYITRLRASVAAERLAAGASDLTELALDLGFADHSHFTNTFRREWGLCPSRFRARFTDKS